MCGERQSKRKSNDILAGSYEDTTLPYITCVFTLIMTGQTKVSILAVLSDGIHQILNFRVGCILEKSR